MHILFALLPNREVCRLFAKHTDILARIQMWLYSGVSSLAKPFENRGAHVGESLTDGTEASVRDIVDDVLLYITTSSMKSERDI